MSLDLEQKPATPTPPRRSPGKWIIGALAAAVVVVAAVASAVLWAGGDSGEKAGPATTGPRTQASASPSAGTSAGSGNPGKRGSSSASPLQLTVRAQQGRCLLPNPGRLKSSAALAFEGTVSAVDAKTHTAVLDVTRWLFADGFGGTDTVRVSLPRVGTESTPTFRQGHTYLVAATGQGQVMGCGFTGEKTSGLSTLYGRAFV